MPVKTMRWRRFWLALPLMIALGACQTASVPQDRLEPGLQGQTSAADLSEGILAEPYSWGVRVVGRAPIAGRASNVQMAWADHCAYVSSSAVDIAGIRHSDADTAGVAVIDVSDPRAPRQVRLLRDRGAYNASETMHAVEAADRAVLAAGNYGGGTGDPRQVPAIDIYDVSDCTAPRLTAEFVWPENVHTVTVSPNGRRVYGTHLEPFTGRGGIHVLDISDLEHPRYLGKFGVTAADGRSWEFAPHEISLSADETRIYAGVIGSRGGDLNAHFTSADGTPAAERLAQDAGGIYILDNTDIVEGRADLRMRLIGVAEHAGWHSVMPANIGGVPFLSAAGELAPCPGSWPQLIDISNETRPTIVGAFQLAMNRRENCPPPADIERQTMGIVGAPGTASSHFNDVDNPTHTRLGLFNFMYAGLRIVDLRTPAHPVEIAYFRPGDPCGGHVRYMPQSGQIWLTCAASGFYVLELTPSARARLR